MNKRVIGKIIGLILLMEAAFMLLPMLVAVLSHEEDWKYFLLTMMGAGILGAILFNIKITYRKLFAREGLIIVGAAWVIMSLVGAVPYFISGYIPDFFSAFFESVSGFTTSGITVVSDVESSGHAMLFWRSLTHWIGGMGVLVFMLAVSPVVGGASMHLMRAEAPGPTVEKIRPKISQTAKWLYAMYFVLTACEIIALMISGMSLFQAVLISFSTLATGGFSYLNSSLASATVAQQIIVEVFMLMAGVNFSIYFLVITGKTKKALHDAELKWYLLIAAAAALFLTLNVYVSGAFGSFSETAHQSVFAALSAMTSTGFAACDYNLWPPFSKLLILLLMFIGGCAGSTAGGIKVSRFILMGKSLRRNIREAANPKGVHVIRFNGKAVPDPVIRSTTLYFSLVFMILVVSMVVVSFEPGMDIATALSSVATTLNNNGLELKNPAFAGFGACAWWTKLVYIIDMLIGRLEIFPILVLLVQLGKPLENSRNAVRRHRMHR